MKIVSGIKLSLVAFTFFAGSARAGTVLGGFDTTRAGSFSPEFGASMTAFRANFATNFPAAAFNSSSNLTSAFLNSIDVLVLSAVFGPTTEITPLTSSEQTALMNFVSAGGAALLFADNDIQFQAASQSILSPFGMDCTGVIAGSVSASVTNVLHPVANGPFGAVTNYTIAAYPGWFDALGPNAIGIAILDPNSQVSLAAIPPGALSAVSGGVVLFSDSTIDDGSFSGSVVTLVDNALSYVLTAQERPTLLITPTNASVLVSWATSTSGYRLQQSTDLRSGVWNDQALTGANQTVVAGTNSHSFFRLIKP